MGVAGWMMADRTIEWTNNAKHDVKRRDNDMVTARQNQALSMAATFELQINIQYHKMSFVVVQEV